MKPRRNARPAQPAGGKKSVNNAAPKSGKWRAAMSRLNHPALPAAIILAVFLLSFAVHLMALGSAYRLPVLSTDEAQYSAVGESIRLGRGYTSRGEFHPAIPPGYPLLVAFGHSLGSDPRLALFVVSCFVISLSVFPVFYLARHLRLGLAAATLLALSTALLPHTFYAALYMTETLALPLMLSGFYYMARWLEDASLKNGVCTGVLLALTILTKVAMAPFLAAVFLTAALELYLHPSSAGRTVGDKLRSGLALIGLPVLAQAAWTLYKRSAGVSALGHYGGQLLNPGEHLTPLLGAMCSLDFLLAAGLVTAVPLVFWLRHRTRDQDLLSILLRLTLLSQLFVNGLLDVGLSGAVRERLFIGALPLIAVFATAGVASLVEHGSKAAKASFLLVPCLAVLGLMAYPFESLSNAIEIPWATALGTFTGTGFGAFQKLRLAAFGVGWILLSAGLVLLWRRSSANHLALSIAVFNAFCFASSAHALTTISREGLPGLEENLRFLARSGATLGSRLLIATDAGPWQSSRAHLISDYFFLEWNRAMGLDGPNVWQLETLGRYDIRPVAQWRQLAEIARPGDYFLTTTRFTNAELAGSKPPYYLFRITAEAARMQPVYASEIPHERVIIVTPGMGQPSPPAAGQDLASGPLNIPVGGSYRLTAMAQGDFSAATAIEFKAADGATLSRTAAAPGQRLAGEFTVPGPGQVFYHLLGRPGVGVKLQGLRLEYIGSEPAPDQLPKMNPVTFTRANRPLEAGPQAATGADCHLDQFNNIHHVLPEFETTHQQGIFLKGWILDRSRMKASDEVFVELNSGSRGVYIARAQRQHRLDLARGLGDLSLLYTGFIMSAPLDGVPAGEYRIRIFQKEPQGVQACGVDYALRVE